MNVNNIIALEEVLIDLKIAEEFYEKQNKGLGAYFKDTIISDIVDGIIKVIYNPAISNENFDAQNPSPDTSSAPYRIYNIGNNAPVQLLDFIETLESSIGIEAKKNFMDMQAGDVVSTYADTNDLIKDFRYKPDTKLADGIE